MIALKHMDLMLGLDVHIVQPPGPVPPVPVPHPHIGMILDVMDYLPGIGGTVYVNGMMRAVSGTSGQAIPPHIPLGGMFIKPPTNDSELFMGSLTVSVDDSPMGFTTMPMMLTCQDVGIAAPPRKKRKKILMTMVLPTTTVIPIPSGPPVLVGGPPSILSVGGVINAAFSLGALKGLRKLAKKSKKLAKKIKRISNVLHKQAEKLLAKLKVKKLGRVGDWLRNQVHKSICTVTGHPVDVATGKVFTEQVDFEIPGPLPLQWERIWYSTSTYEGPLGHGWHHSYDLALHVDKEVLLLRTADGRHIILPPLPAGKEFFERVEKLTLKRDERGAYSVRNAEGLEYFFESKGEYRRLTLLQDALGNTLNLTYGPTGYLQRIKDAGGREFNFHHDQEGLLQYIDGPHPDDPKNRKITLAKYQYDDLNNLVYAHDALGQTMCYEYKSHLLAREVNRNRLSFYFTYDGKDEKARCIRTWGDDGIYDHKLTYTLTSTVVKNSLGKKTTYHHRGGLVWKTVDALGIVTLTDRNDWNELVGETDALGQTTESKRDDRGNLIEEKSPDGSKVTIAYNGTDLPIQLQGPAGGQWAWQYDDRGRLVERTDALGQRTQFHWSGSRLQSVVDPSGQRTSLEYDLAGNLISLKTPDGAETHWEYDGLGRCHRVIDPAGNVETRQTDALGCITQVREPDGNVRDLSYDGEGNVVRAKDRHYDVEFTYSGMNRLRSRKQAGTTVRFRYDTEEQLISINNEAGSVYRFVLGPTGEVNEEHGFDGLCRKYVRDKAGRVQKVLRPGGLATEYAYDPVGRVLGTKHLDLAGNSIGEEKYSYRPDGELVEADNGTVGVKLERDLLGRVIKETQGADTVESEYGPLSLRTRMKTSRGHALEIERNIVGDVIAMRAGGGPIVSANSDAKRDDSQSPWEVRFTRDKLGLEIERSLPGGVRARWERDKLGRPLKQEIWSGKKLVGTRSYTWEPNDRLKMIVDALKGPVQYQHDGLGNLLSAAYSDGKVDLRMPDAVGNLFKAEHRKDRKYGPAGQLVESHGPEGVTRYEYDPEGNLAKKLLPDGSEWKYEWNAAGMLAKVLRPDGKIVEFGYDALGRRVWKKYGAKTTKWVWDGNVPVHEWVEVDPKALAVNQAAPSTESQLAATEAAIRQRQAVLSAQPSQGPPSPGTPPAVTWIFEPESFAPIAKLSDGERNSIITDHLGTPTTMLDSAGHEVWSADIGVCGDLRNVVGDKQACPFRWPGQYEDEETGLYYNRFRYYDPESGEYVSQDPIGLLGGLNQYGYTHNPLCWSDPLGLASCAKNYKGVKDASALLRRLGVSSNARKEILQSFDIRTIRVRKSGSSEYGIRYFDGNLAQARGRYLFETFPATRQSLALPPSWNQMTGLKQWRIRPGVKIIEGKAASQGASYPGGQTQKFVPNLGDLL